MNAPGEGKEKTSPALKPVGNHASFAATFVSLLPQTPASLTSRGRLLVLQMEQLRNSSVPITFENVDAVVNNFEQAVAQGVVEEGTCPPLPFLFLIAQQ